MAKISIGVVSEPCEVLLRGLRVIAGEAGFDFYGPDRVSTAPHLNIVFVDIGTRTETIEAWVQSGPVVGWGFHPTMMEIDRLQKLGARGFVNKDAPVADIVAFIKFVASGQTVWPMFHGRAVPTFSELTPREIEILHLLAEGKTVKEIAGMLFTSSGTPLSVKTVGAHTYNLMRKMGLHNRTQLVRFVLSQETEARNQEQALPA